jgi:hypothetical protein
VGGGGALSSRGQSERESEGAGQRVQMREGRWASRARGSKGVRGLKRGRRTCGRGRVHGGEIVGERLDTGKQVGTAGQRERERARARETAPTARPHGAAIEREGGERALGLAPTGGTRLSDTGDARAGLNGPTWAEMFYFPGISIAFSIYFL